MTDESGVPAADGVTPEENVDPLPADPGTEEAAVEEAAAEEAAAAKEAAAEEAAPAVEVAFAEDPAAEPIPLAPVPPPPPPKGVPEQGIPPGDRVGLFGSSLFGLFVLAVGVGLIYVLIKIWPKVPHGPSSGGGGTGGGGNDKPVDLFWGLLKFNLLAETALIFVTAVMGGIGATVFIAVSFSDYVGNRRFAKSWIWFYLVRLFVGPALAVIFYFTLRGGFLATSSSGSDINAYGVAAMAGLVGLFSKQAGDKLRQVFDALFQVDPGTGDAARGDGVANPAPTISGIEPALTTSAETLTFTLQGSGFIEASTVSVGRSASGEQPTLVPRATTFASESEVQVTLLTEDVSQPGQLWISVTNPAPGGGTAGPQAFDIT